MTEYAYMMTREYATLPGIHVERRLLTRLVTRMAADVNIPPDERSGWTWRVLEEAERYGQVTLDKDRAVALVSIVPRSRWSEAHVADMRVWVDPRYRGQGIGRETVEWALKNAEAAGIIRVEAINYETNERAHNWLLSLGFRNEGYRAKAIRTDTDGIIGAYMMACILGDQ